MKFNLDTWNSYRQEAAELANYLATTKNEIGIMDVDKHTKERYIASITLILRQCSKYIDKCGIGMPVSLWKYNNKDTTTHPSSKKFAYKHCMTNEQIKNYGSDFMSE